MLDELFTAPWAATRLRSSHLGPWLDSFDSHLETQGYTCGTRRSYVLLAADLGRWMQRDHMCVDRLEESILARYVTQRVTQPERRTAAAKCFLAYLRAEGVVHARVVREELSPAAALAQRYASYMHRERGAAEGTVKGYVDAILGFFAQCLPADAADVRSITPSCVGAYVREYAVTRSPKRVAYVVSALRSFFRFIFAIGETPTDLTCAAPTVQLSHLPDVPKYLSPEEVTQLLDTCDPNTHGGRRNRAILLLLVRLGLRAGEVAALELEDLRWKCGEIVVCGKGDVIAHMPLLPEVGAAIAAYLKLDRVPEVATRRVFLRLLAPLRALSGRGAVSTVVRTHLAQAGLAPAARGSHLLRHTLGTQMLRCGASMSEIGQVLRHRSPASAAVYAKVAFDALRTLAQPWPCDGEVR